MEQPNPQPNPTPNSQPNPTPNLQKPKPPLIQTTVENSTHAFALALLIALLVAGVLYLMQDQLVVFALEHPLANAYLLTTMATFVVVFLMYAILHQSINFDKILPRVNM